LRHTLLQNYIERPLNPSAPMMRGVSFRQQNALLPIRPNTTYVWQRWQGFIQALAAAMLYRCPFFVFSRPALRPFSEAFSFYT
jgi:hypothetical protein